MTAIKSAFEGGFPANPVVSGSAAINTVLTASSPTAAAWQLGLVQQAATPAAGFALQITPTTLAASAQASGGTFTANTYFWVVTFVTAAGESPASNEDSATIVLNGSCNLTWTAPPSNVTAVKVYRGTSAGAENRLVATLGAVASYTDTGIAGTAGSPPGTSGTPTIISWTAPNDGRQHRVVAMGGLSVSSAETGGLVNISLPLPNTATIVQTFFSANQGSFTAIGNFTAAIIGPNETVSILQASALTGGAAIVWAELWAS